MAIVESVLLLHQGAAANLHPRPSTIALSAIGSNYFSQAREAGAYTGLTAREF